MNDTSFPTFVPPPLYPSASVISSLAQDREDKDSMALLLSSLSRPLQITRAVKCNWLRDPRWPTARKKIRSSQCRKKNWYIFFPFKFLMVASFIWRIKSLLYPFTYSSSVVTDPSKKWRELIKDWSQRCDNAILVGILGSEARPLACARSTTRVNQTGISGPAGAWITLGLALFIIACLFEPLSSSALSIRIISTARPAYNIVTECKSLTVVIAKVRQGHNCPFHLLLPLSMSTYWIAPGRAQNTFSHL